MYAEVAATGTVAEDGVLKIKFNVAADNNVSWLSFKNVKFEKHITVDPIIEAAKTALLDAITAAKAIETEGKNGGDVLAAAITTAETALNAADATVESLTAAKETLLQAKSVFNRANLEEGLVEIAQNQGKDLDNFTRAELVEGEGFNTYTVNGDLNIAFKMMNIDVIDEQQYYQFAAKHLSANGQQIDEATFHELYQLVDGYTWFVQALLNRLYQTKNPQIDFNTVSQTLNRILQEEVSSYQMYCRLITDRQLRVIRAIAKEGNVKEPGSNAFLQKYQLGAYSTVRGAILAMVEKELLYQKEDGSYVVYDKFFGHWLKQYIP